MIRGLNHIGINSSDIDRLAIFYKEALGFAEATDEIFWKDNALLDAVLGLKGSAARQLMLRSGNCFLELFEFSSPPARGQPPLRACDRGLTHFAIDVADIESEVVRLRQLGMHFLMEEAVEIGGMKAIYGQDPDGNLVELIELAPDHPYALEQLR